jgi:hypothetical protein
MATHGQLPGQVSVATSHGYVALQAGVGGSSPPSSTCENDPGRILTGY